MNQTHEYYQPGEVLLTAEQIADVVKELGARITADYQDRNPVLVNLLKGGVVFLADLIRQLPIPHQIDFLSISSYEGDRSSGVVRIVEDLQTKITDRDVIVVEDVLDTGQTLAYILDMLEIRSPRSVEVCSLLKKQSAREAEVEIKYLGIEIPDVFVVGYGLDYDERFRNLPHLAKLVVPESEL